MALTITFPQDGSVVQTSTVRANGNASDSDGIATIEYSLNDGDWTEATIDAEIGINVKWSIAELSLEMGANTLAMRITDDLANVGDPVTFTFTLEGSSFSGNHGAHWAGQSGGSVTSWTGIDWRYL